MAERLGRQIRERERDLVAGGGEEKIAISGGQKR